MRACPGTGPVPRSSASILSEEHFGEGEDQNWGQDQDLPGLFEYTLVLFTFPGHPPTPGMQQHRGRLRYVQRVDLAVHADKDAKV